MIFSSQIEEHGGGLGEGCGGGAGGWHGDGGIGVGDGRVGGIHGGLGALGGGACGTGGGPGGTRGGVGGNGDIGSIHVLPKGDAAVLLPMEPTTVAWGPLNKPPDQSARSMNATKKIRMSK